MKNKIRTIGHSNRSFNEFLDMLNQSGVQMLVDVRRFPGSAKYPQFNSEALESELKKNDVVYRHMPELGGRRKMSENSKNTAWKNKSFRGYADHMETEEFGKALDKLKALTEKTTVAIMCSEAVWWRCHRSLIADALKSQGYEVQHIMAPGKEQEHPYTSPAKIVDGRLSYGSDQLEIF